MSTTYINKSTFIRLVRAANDLIDENDTDDQIREKIGLIVENLAGYEDPKDQESLIKLVFKEIKRVRRWSKHKKR